MPTDEKNKSPVAALTVTHGLDHSFENLLPPLVLLLAADLGLSMERIGILGWITYLFFGLMSLPAGFLTDRFGERRTLLLFYGGSALSAFLIALAPDRFELLILLFVFHGSAIGLYHASSLPALARTDVKRRGRALGLHGIGGSVGVAIAPYVAAVTGSRFGWRVPYVILGVLTIFTGIWFTSSTKHHKSAKRSKADAPRRSHPGFLGALRSGPVLLLIFARALEGLFYRGTMFIFPVFLTAALATTISGGGLFTSMALLGGVLGQLSGGWLADRFGARQVLAAFYGLDAVFLTLLARMGLPAAVTNPGEPSTTGILATVASAPLLLVVAFLFMFALYGSQPAANSLLAGLTKPEYRGRMFGLLFVSTFGLGAFGAYAAARLFEIRTGGKQLLDEIFVYTAEGAAAFQEIFQVAAYLTVGATLVVLSMALLPRPDSEERPRTIS